MNNDIASLKEKTSIKLPLKFKAYSHTYKRLFDVVNLCNIVGIGKLEGNITFEGNEGDVWDATFDNNDYTLLQSVGFTDCNGVVLYVGDVVVDDFGRIMMIGYWCGRYQFIALTETNFRHADFFDWLYRHKHPENETVLYAVRFIKNIYEVTDIQELLKNIKKII